MMMQNIEEDTSKFILKSVIQVDEDIEREKQLTLEHNMSLLKMAKKS